VDDYIAAQPLGAQATLRRVRTIIRTCLRGAEEVISYNIPAYKLAGRPVIYFAGWKQHYSLYPATKRVLAAFKKDLAAYEVRGNTIRFPLSVPVPAKLIGRIARFRAEEVG
jgi:uncharacterized protein YdhG (YjbR/CyaY superfamily)